jgi:hypothetical protein
VIATPEFGLFVRGPNRAALDTTASARGQGKRPTR